MEAGILPEDVEDFPDFGKVIASFLTDPAVNKGTDPKE